MTTQQRIKNQKVYDTIKSLMYKHSTKFDKKHGNWLIRYAPQNQVVYMDTWNGCIYQSHCDFEIENDGYPDCKLKAHTVVSNPDHTYGELKIDEAISIYKTLLNVI